MKGIEANGKTDPLIVQEIFQGHLGREATDAEIDRVLARYVRFLSDEVAHAERYRIMPGVDGALRACEERTASGKRPLTDSIRPLESIPR